MTDIIIPSTKKFVIFDATLLTTLMGCPQLVDLRFNHKFQSIKGKPNSIECGSIVHKILEEFYKEKIKGFSRVQAISSGLIAGQLYIQGCRYCVDFEAHDCVKCKGTGTNLDPIMEIGDNQGIGDILGCNYCNKGRVIKPQCGHQVNEYPGVMNTPAEDETKPKRIGYKWVLETMEQYFDRWKNEMWVPLEVEYVRRKVLYEDVIQMQLYQ